MFYQNLSEEHINIQLVKCTLQLMKVNENLYMVILVWCKYYI